MVIKFLKLPLKRKSGDAKNQLREAEDPNRKEVFRACLTVSGRSSVRRNGHIITHPA